MLLKRNNSLFYTLLNEPLTFLGGLLFFLMLFSPAYYVVFKIVLITILLASILLSRVVFDKLNVTKEVFLWYMIFVFHGIFFSIYGYLNGNNTNYLIRSSAYNIVWPGLYLIFTIGLYKKISLSFFIKVIVIANLLISLYLIGSALTLFGVIPPLNIIKFEMSELAFDFKAGLIKIEAPSVICMLFTVPFVISLTLLNGAKTFGFKKWFLNISILASIVAIICTARRALILNIFFGFLFTIFLGWRSNTLNKRLLNRNVLRMLFIGLIVVALVLITVQQYGLVDLSLVYEKFTSAFSSKENLSDKSTSIRYDQFDLLIKSWAQKPLLGYGHGAVSEFVVRSKITPWIYELSYVALLFQTGIIGLVIYLGLLFWPIYKGMQIIKNGSAESQVFILPCIVGWVSFLIANGTNPYLISYDYMWALFFPVAIVNYFMKEDNASV